MPNPIDPEREPTADMRTAAVQMREVFVSLVREGFSEMQALQIIGYVVAAAVKPKDD